MAAPAPILGIDPKLYRHFAAVTLLISLSVAMFASGESAQDAPGAAAVEKAPAPQPTVTLTDKRKSPSPPPPADSGDESEFVGEDGFDSSEMPGSATLSVPPPDAIQIELDPRESARMTPQQQEAALKDLAAEKKRREAQGPYRPTALELQRLRNASALRSGSSGDD
ncbi:hypothetical protein [Novosphingobium sp.]|uniref:hypothetical protein n=1 Tax=Novosphingobium sp. TaxID=1874826 RepID=UPI0038B93B21|nr:hypothetical protein [Pseudomonadota bacterium]